MTHQPAEYGESSQAVLQIYQLSVEMADRVSARRTTSNNFFLAIQAALAGLLGTLALGDGTPDGQPVDRVLLVAAAFAGVVIACSWWLLLRSYRDLNRAKYQVICDIEEEHLPVQPFQREWDELKKDPVKGWRGRYAEQGQVERVVPAVFALMYLVLLGWALIA